MGPIIPVEGISQEINLLVAFLIGIGFGFALEQAGFSSSRKLAGMFYGYDATVLKVFFTAAITAMLGLLFFNYLEIIDLSVVYVNDYYMKSAIIGGIIMGAGFIIGGFCPGTSVCAAAIGKIDAIVFVFGSMIGIFIFGVGFTLWEEIYNADHIGQIVLPEMIGMSYGFFGFLVIVAAVFMFWLADKAEIKFSRDDITKEL